MTERDVVIVKVNVAVHTGAAGLGLWAYPVLAECLHVLDMLSVRLNKHRVLCLDRYLRQPRSK